MTNAHALPRPARLRHAAVSLTALVALFSTGFLLPIGAAQAATTVPLGTAGSFAVLAGSTITNTGSSTVTGDVGLHPGSAVTGFGPGADAVALEGSLHVADGVALQAKTDLDTAYTNAMNQTPVTEVPTELGGTTLKAGVYDSAAGEFGVTGALTLDGENNADAVFIFQMASTLTTAAASSVNLINGADICNVYWQVGSSATLGGNSTFLGTIMADQSVSLTSGATVEGRVLARVGAVTMDTNTITNSACSTPTGGGDTTGGDDTTGADEATGGDDTTGADDATGGGDTTGSDDATDEATGSDDATGSDEATDDTTGAEDATDDTTNGDDATGGDQASGDDAISGGETTGQVREIPSGAVAAGGGGVETATGSASSLPAILTLLLTVGTAAIIARRRVRVR